MLKTYKQCITVHIILIQFMCKYTLLEKSVIKTQIITENDCPPVHNNIQ